MNSARSVRAICAHSSLEDLIQRITLSEDHDMGVIRIHLSVNSHREAQGTQGSKMDETICQVSFSHSGRENTDSRLGGIEVRE